MANIENIQCQILKIINTCSHHFLTLLSAGEAQKAPLSRICVYACVYAYTCANFFLTIPHFDSGSGGNILAPQKFSILPGKFKVGHYTPLS